MTDEKDYQFLLLIIPVYKEYKEITYRGNFLRSEYNLKRTKFGSKEEYFNIETEKYLGRPGKTIKGHCIAELYPKEAYYINGEEVPVLVYGFELHGENDIVCFRVNSEEKCFECNGIYDSKYYETIDFDVYRNDDRFVDTLKTFFKNNNNNNNNDQDTNFIDFEKYEPYGGVNPNFLFNMGNTRRYNKLDPSKWNIPMFILRKITTIDTQINMVEKEIENTEKNLKTKEEEVKKTKKYLEVRRKELEKLQKKNVVDTK